MSAIIPAIVPVAIPVGRVRAPRNRSISLAYGLAMAEHNWRWESPLSLPEVPPGLDTLTAIVSWAAVHEAAGYWDSGDNPGFWRPDVVERGGNLVWRPWSGEGTRFIEISASGEIAWNSGSRLGSKFIGSCLVAAAGGLTKLPFGVVKLMEIKE